METAFGEASPKMRSVEMAHSANAVDTSPTVGPHLGIAFAANLMKWNYALDYSPPAPPLKAELHINM